jgi:hypothetical protein
VGYGGKNRGVSGTAFVVDGAGQSTVGPSRRIPAHFAALPDQPCRPGLRRSPQLAFPIVVGALLVGDLYLFSQSRVEAQSLSVSQLPHCSSRTAA